MCSIIVFFFVLLTLGATCLVNYVQTFWHTMLTKCWKYQNRSSTCAIKDLSVSEPSRSLCCNNQKVCKYILSNTVSILKRRNRNTADIANSNGITFTPTQPLLSPSNNQLPLPDCFPTQQPNSDKLFTASNTLCWISIFTHMLVYWPAVSSCIS